MKTTKKTVYETPNSTGNESTVAQRAADLWHPDNFTDTIKIDVSLIPDHVRDNLVAQLGPIVTEFFKQPGVREEYEEWLKNRKKAASAVKKEGAEK